MSMEVVEVSTATSVIPVFTRLPATLYNIAGPSVIISPTAIIVLLIVVVIIIFPILLIVLPVTTVDSCFIPAVAP